MVPTTFLYVLGLSKKSSNLINKILITRLLNMLEVRCEAQELIKSLLWLEL